MQKFSDKELKKEFESSRGQLKFAFIGLVFLAVGTGAFLTLVFDPLGWLTGPPAVREAKKWIAICICFIWLPVLAGIWFMVIRPLQTGIVTGGSKHRASYVVLRSEEPARFRAHIWWNCVLLTTGLVFAAWCLMSFIRDLQKARAGSPNQTLQPMSEVSVSSAPRFTSLGRALARKVTQARPNHYTLATTRIWPTSC